MTYKLALKNQEWVIINTGGTTPKLHSAWGKDYKKAKQICEDLNRMDKLWEDMVMTVAEGGKT